MCQIQNRKIVCESVGLLRLICFTVYEKVRLSDDSTTAHKARSRSPVAHLLYKNTVHNNDWIICDFVNFLKTIS